MVILVHVDASDLSMREPVFEGERIKDAVSKMQDLIVGREPEMAIRIVSMYACITHRNDGLREGMECVFMPLSSEPESGSGQDPQTSLFVKKNRLDWTISFCVPLERIPPAFLPDRDVFLIEDKERTVGGRMGIPAIAE